MIHQLYDYQFDGVHEIRTAMRSERRVLYQLPTGGGKTVIFSYIAREAKKKGKRIMAIAHRRELLAQASAHFTEQGIGHSVIAPGYKFYPETPVQIASVDSLIRRKISGNKWGSTLERWPNAYTLGVTATPRRLDGKALGDTFGALVEGPSMQALIGMGRLSRYELIGARLIQTEGSHVRMGDFVAEDIEEINDMSVVIGDTVETFKKMGRPPALVFGSSLKAAERLRERFSDYGYRSYCLHYKTTQASRRTSICSRLAVLCGSSPARSPGSSTTERITCGMGSQTMTANGASQGARPRPRRTRRPRRSAPARSA